MDHALESIIDGIRGNKYSHAGRLLDFNVSDSKVVNFEFSVDVFFGALMGNSPFDSQRVYRATVQDFNV